MSCFVDKLKHRPAKENQAFRTGRRWNHQWCHLWADSLEELHAMAESIGMKREWFQDREGFPHYDLVPARRGAAVKRGAIEVDLKEWLRKRPQSS